jgi:hypothetical protein
MGEAVKCRHCGKLIKSVNWYNGPGWTHEDETIGRWCQITGAAPELTHGITDGEAVTGCCGRTPFELSRTERITVDPALVNCEGPKEAS